MESKEKIEDILTQFKSAGHDLKTHIRKIDIIDKYRLLHALHEMKLLITNDIETIRLENGEKEND